MIALNALHVGPSRTLRGSCNGNLRQCASSCWLRIDPFLMGRRICWAASFGVVHKVGSRARSDGPRLARTVTHAAGV